MLDLKGIRNIVFDLGGVLLNLDFEATISAFNHLGLPRKVLDKSQGYADRIFYELELGNVTPEIFRNRIRELLKINKLSDHKTDKAWCAMILDIPADRVKILQQLKNRYNLYLFSNTNQIHIGKLHQWFRETYGFEFAALFVRDIYSHEIHERKPDRSSFEKVLKITGINPAESLFIDDLEKNIKGAEDTGFKTFWLNNDFELKDIFPDFV